MPNISKVVLALLVASASARLNGSPANCQEMGSVTNCEAIDTNAYCGISDQEAAIFGDGTGCSCKWNFVYTPGVGCVGDTPVVPGANMCGESWVDAAQCHTSCTDDMECPDGQSCFASIECDPNGYMNLGAGPENCQEMGSETKCGAKDSHAYCGDSDEVNARFTDGSGCSCKWGFVYNADTGACDGTDPPAGGSNMCGKSWVDAGNCDTPCDDNLLCPEDLFCFASIECPSELAAADYPHNCQEPGSMTDCPAMDAHAYCGTSVQDGAVFTDGSGCSCKWGYAYNAETGACDGTAPPATGSNMCGKTWVDAGNCDTPCDDNLACPEGTYCFASIECPSGDEAAVIGGVADYPRNCQEEGSMTDCPAMDDHAYCGTSVEDEAVFTDGSGCSCKWGWSFDAETTTCVGGVDPVPPAGGDNYCGKSWSEAAACDVPCDELNQCPEGLLCFASIQCSDEM